MSRSSITVWLVTSKSQAAESQQTGPQVTVCDGTDASELEQVTRALQVLIPQLSSSAAALSQERVTEIARHDACTLLVAKMLVAKMPAGDALENNSAADQTQIVGAMVLVVFPLPTGQRAWIEDVVVDESARGKGVGEALNRRAIELATAAGARTIDLTSRPSREAANRLYLRLGFEQRATNLYRMELG